MRHYLTYVIFLIVIGVGVLTYLGWKDWAQHRLEAGGQGWRNVVTLIALLSVSLVALLFVAYTAHNVAVGGDRNGNATTLLCIRSGNYLSLASVVLGLMGKGRGRWSALFGGCFFLLFWLAQGMSL
jgi:hypothetical protein